MSYFPLFPKLVLLCNKSYWEYLFHWRLNLVVYCYLEADNNNGNILLSYLYLPQKDLTCFKIYMQ